MTTDSAQNRFARQVQYAPIGDVGQRRIEKSCVAVLGCGALGTVAAEILVRAGVGRLRLIDRDVVEWSNLQRQSLFDERDAKLGRSKAHAAGERLAAIHHGIEIETIVRDVTPENIQTCLGHNDLVIDATDNFAIRFLLNDWALSTGTPWVHGGCVGATGQVIAFSGTDAPCFRCLVPEPPPAASVDTCDTAGVIGPATHVVASLQAAEALKILSGNTNAVRRQLLSVDVWNNRFRELAIDGQFSRDCSACKKRDFEFLSGERAAGSQSGIVLCGRDAVQIMGNGTLPIEFDTLADRWDGLGRVQVTPFFVRLHPNKSSSLTLFRDGRAVIQGTSDLQEARMLYDRYVGG